MTGIAPALARFCSKLFRGFGGADDLKASREITPADLAALPREARLLLAHCLEGNNPDLTLMDNDKDVSGLLPTGWLLSIPSSKPGFSQFKFKLQSWHYLDWLRPKFLTHQMLSELKAYRLRKNGEYPWNW